MKKLILFILIILLTEGSSYWDCNYITDYYQLVYEAEMDYFDGNFEQAYTKLKAAESNCTLLNQEFIYEMILLAVVAEKVNKPKEAFYYLEKALQNGFPFKYFDLRLYDIADLKKYPEWNILEMKADIFQKSFMERINIELREEILSLVKEENDRRRGIYPPNIVAIADSMNEHRLKDIFSSYGFPNAQLIGYPRENEDPYMVVLMQRLKDTPYFEKVLLDFIRKGECPPFLLAMIKESENLAQGNKALYGLGDNIDSTGIEDFRNLDKRRLAIGLRPWKMRKKYIRRLLNRKFPTSTIGIIELPRVEK